MQIEIPPGATSVTVTFSTPEDPTPPPAAWREGLAIADHARTWHAVDAMLRVPGATLIAGVRADGVQTIAQIDDGGAVHVHPLAPMAAFPADDHNVIAMRWAGASLLAVRPGHNDDRDLRLYRGPDASNLPWLGSFRQSGLVSYGQWFERDQRLFCATRTGVDRWSANELIGDGFVSRGHVFDAGVQCYLGMRDGGGLAWTHPKKSDPTQGNIYQFNWMPGDAPRNIANMTPAWTPVAGRSSRVVDISPDADRALIVEFDATAPWSPLTAEYVVLSGLATGTVVEDRTGVMAGHDIWETYFLGGCFDAVDGALWLCWLDGDTYRLSRRETDGTMIDVLSSDRPLCRPLSTDGPVRVSVCEVERYAGEVPYRDFRMTTRTVLV